MPILGSPKRAARRAAKNRREPEQLPLLDPGRPVPLIDPERLVGSREEAIRRHAEKRWVRGPGRPVKGKAAAGPEEEST